jgi:hypothetical protein
MLQNSFHFTNTDWIYPVRDFFKITGFSKELAAHYDHFVTVGHNKCPFKRLFWKKYIIAVITLSTWNFQVLKTENISHAEWHFGSYQTMLPTYNFLDLNTEHTVPLTRLYIVAWQHILLYLYVQPSSWRWTLGFETCRRQIKILI